MATGVRPAAIAGVVPSALWFLIPPEFLGQEGPDFARKYPPRASETARKPLMLKLNHDA
jgi:hypothetical protein